MEEIVAAKLITSDEAAETLESLPQRVAVGANKIFQGCGAERFASGEQ